MDAYLKLCGRAVFLRGLRPEWSKIDRKGWNGLNGQAAGLRTWKKRRNGAQRTAGPVKWWLTVRLHSSLLKPPTGVGKRHVATSVIVSLQTHISPVT